MKRVVITWSDVRTEVASRADERKIPEGWAFDITSPQYLVGQVLGKMIREVPEYMHLVHADGQELLVFEGEEPKDKPPEKESPQKDASRFAPTSRDFKAGALNPLRQIAWALIRTYNATGPDSTQLRDMIGALRISLLEIDKVLGEVN